MRYLTDPKNSVRTTVVAIALGVALVGLLTTHGCSGDGDGVQLQVSDLNIAYTGKTGTADLTATSVLEILAELGIYVPGCVVSESEPVAGVQMLLPLAATASVRSPLVGAPIEVAATDISFEVTGSCGGRAYFVGVHEDGDTTGTLTFEDYCYSDTVSGETTVNGDVDLVLDGTPSPTGPIVDEVRAFSPELGLVSSGGGQLTLAFSGFTYVFGNPAPVNPDPPTELNPDLLEVDVFLVRNDNTGAVGKLEDFHVTGFKDDLGQVVISGTGRIYFPDYGYVDLATADGRPLVIDPIALATGQPFITSGQLVLTGTNNVTVTLTVEDLVSVLVATMEDPLFPPTTFDCSAFDTSGLLEALAAIKSIL